MRSSGCYPPSMSHVAGWDTAHSVDVGVRDLDEREECEQIDFLATRLLLAGFSKTVCPSCCTAVGCGVISCLSFSHLHILVYEARMCAVSAVFAAPSAKDYPPVPKCSCPALGPQISAVHRGPHGPPQITLSPTFRILAE